MVNIKPCLWLDADLADVADYYASIFPNFKLESLNRLPDGNVATAEFEIEGQRFMALNGGAEFKFNEAVSFFVTCDGQDEVDRYWTLLTADGGEESQCGWLKDKYGLSWQIVPSGLMELQQRDEPEKVQRMFEEMLTMRKLDMPRLQRAFDGE